MSSITQIVTYANTHFNNTSTCSISLHLGNNIPNTKSGANKSKEHIFMKKHFSITFYHNYAHLCITSQIHNYSLYQLVIGISNLNQKIDEDNGTSCLLWPPMLLPLVGGSSIIPLWKTPSCSSTSLLVDKGFPQEPCNTLIQTKVNQCFMNDC